MAHFAELNEKYEVVRVVVVNNDVLNNEEFPASEPLGIDFCRSLFGATTNWVQTSYNGSFRGEFAGIGYTYDPANDVFVSPPRPPSPPMPPLAGQTE